MRSRVLGKPIVAIDAVGESPPQSTKHGGKFVTRRAWRPGSRREQKTGRKPCQASRRAGETSVLRTVGSGQYRFLLCLFLAPRFFGHHGNVLFLDNLSSRGPALGKNLE